MTFSTDTASRSAHLRRERERTDIFAVVALLLSFVLAMIGLALTANPSPVLEPTIESPYLIGP
jgi:hypothetical protein